MRKITTLKWFEIIKNLIILEDYETIHLHKDKLKSLEPDDTVRDILQMIENKAYGDAAMLIEKYIMENSQLTAYDDLEVQGLKLELKLLENELSELFSKKAEIERVVHEFTIKYNQALGDLIGELFRLKRERLKKEAAVNPEKQGEYEEVKEDYQSFNKAFEESKKYKSIDLAGDELDELKKKYRRACKLCHPDMVSEDVKAKASEIFHKLNKAYEENDLQQVGRILEMLEKGDIFMHLSDSLSDKERLRLKIVEARQQIYNIRQEMEALKQNETYQTIITIQDWNEYFEELKSHLQDEIRAYKHTAKE